MFEFTAKVVNRGGFRFVAESIDGKFVYNTTDKKEIEVLIESGFKEIKKKAKKTKES